MCLETKNFSFHCSIENLVPLKIRRENNSLVVRIYVRLLYTKRTKKNKNTNAKKEKKINIFFSFCVLSVSIIQDRESII
jgi:hypothetical protein